MKMTGNNNKGKHIPAEAPLPEVGVFYRRPHTTRQRDRWITLLNILNTETIHTLAEMQDALKRHGHGVNLSSMRNDMDQLRIVRIDGVYMQTSPSGHVELMALLRQRLIVVCEAISYLSPNLVLLKTNTGAAAWLAAVIKEVDEDDVQGVMWQDDAVWLAVEEQDGQAVMQRYLKRWRGTDESYVHQPTPSVTVRRPV